MSKRFTSLAVATAAMSVSALGSTGALASGHPYEACLTARALALEPVGTEVSEVVAEAERACGDKKGRLSDAAASDASQKVRLAVMQQRSNARNLERRP
jgi:hypothetical protein